MLTILDGSLRVEESLLAKLSHYQQLNRILSRKPIPSAGPRTAVLLRCSTQEADRIRVAAQRRETSISGFVLHSLHRAWQVKP
jgi:hypothetical protein